MKRSSGPIKGWFQWQDIAFFIEHSPSHAALLITIYRIHEGDFDKRFLLARLDMPETAISTDILREVIYAAHRAEEH